MLNKKVIAKVLAAVSLVGVLAGCGSTKTSSTGETVVRFWTNDGGGSAVWQEMIAEYNDTIGKEENIKIEYTLYSDAYGDILETAFESRQVAELVALVGKTDQRIAKGQIMPFNRLPGWEKVEEEYAEYIKEGGNTFNGEIYTLPYNITTFGLIYNKDLFKAAGIVDENGEAKPPVTWEEYAAVAKKLTDPKKNQYGVILPMKWSGYWGYEGEGTMESSVDVYKLNRSTMTYEYEKLAPFFEALMQIKKDGSYYPGAEGIDNDPARAQFATGNIGMKFGASWDVGVLRDQFPAECDWDFAPFPVIDPEQRYEQMSQFGSIAGVSAFVPEEKLEAVGKVLKWMYSDEVAIKLYEKEINIPIKPEIAQMANTENISKQWQSAQELAKISKPYQEQNPLPLDLKIKNTTKASDVYKRIWSEGAEIEASLKALSKEHTTDLKAAFSDLGEDIDKYKLNPGYRPLVQWKEES